MFYLRAGRVNRHAVLSTHFQEKWAPVTGTFGDPGNFVGVEIIDMKYFLAAALVVVSCAGVARADELGQATYYTNPYHPGMIAAHKTLPFGSRVRVTNLDNGRAAIVTIVDRGPFARGRIIDVSTYAAGVLGFRMAGVAHVRLQKL